MILLPKTMINQMLKMLEIKHHQHHKRMLNLMLNQMLKTLNLDQARVQAILKNKHKLKRKQMVLVPENKFKSKLKNQMLFKSIRTLLILSLTSWKKPKAIKPPKSN